MKSIKEQLENSAKVNYKELELLLLERIAKALEAMRREMA